MRLPKAVACARHITGFASRSPRFDQRILSIASRRFIIPNPRSTASFRPISIVGKEEAASITPNTNRASQRTPSFRVAKIKFTTGEVTFENLDITDLIRNANILPRDLFTLNVTSRQERRTYKLRRTPAAIVPRDNIIILSFGNVRAVVGLDCAYVLDAHNPAMIDLAHELGEVYEGKTYVPFRSGRLTEMGQDEGEDEPSELIFLECVLQDTVDSFQRRLRLFEPIVDSVLDKVDEEVYSDTGVHQLGPLKDSLQAFDIRVKNCIECLAGMLNKDDEMLSLLITEQKVADDTGQEVEFSRHEHVELLVGVYARQLNNIAGEIQYILGRLQSKQEFVSLSLAGYRNRMVRMHVHIATTGLALGLGTTVAGFFGMNLVNGLEESAYAFNAVISLSGMGGLVVALSSFNFLSGRALQESAAQRLSEIETLTNALSEISAVDYAIKTTVGRGDHIDKESFRKVLQEARMVTKATDEEVDLLFDVLDREKDGWLGFEDFGGISPASELTNGEKSTP